MKVSLIVPCYNQLFYTKFCVESILKYTTCPYELILIDNGSSDNTDEYFYSLKTRLSRDPLPYCRLLKIIINKKNKGVCGALNQGIRDSRGSYVCYLNNDVIVTDGWLAGLVACAEKNGNIGIVGCSINGYAHEGNPFPDIKGFRGMDEIQKTAAAISLVRKGQTVDTIFVDGYAMLIKREVIDTIGYFDERFYPCWGDDFDYSLRARKAGYVLVKALDVFVFHFYSKSVSSQQFNAEHKSHSVVRETSRRKFIDKWGEEGDALFGVTPYNSNEINAAAFKKEYKNSYKLIQEALLRHGVRMGIPFSVTPGRLADVFNGLATIANFIPLLEKNEGLHKARLHQADTETVRRNKHKLTLLYPRTLKESRFLKAIKAITGHASENDSISRRARKFI